MMLEKDAIEKGKLIQAAFQVFEMYNMLDQDRIKGGNNDEILIKVAYQAEAELKRLIGNKIQFHNEIGDPVQLASLIIFLTEGYVPKTTSEQGKS